MLYTIGHSTRTFQEFLALLRAHGIERVADVRTVPRSRRVPWTERGRLGRALRSRRIAYAHAPELGGLRHARKDSPNGAWRNSGFRGYADYMATPEFEAGLRRLNRWARARRTAVMCAEALPWRCHRSLIADAETARGIPVRHIMSATSARPHRMTPFAKVRRGRPPRVLYPPEHAKVRG
jgi:uncharacterized protein (DUF488 family)